MGVSEQPWHRLWCYLQAVGSGAVVWVCSRVERGLRVSVPQGWGAPGSGGPWDVICELRVRLNT